MRMTDVQWGALMKRAGYPSLQKSCLALLEPAGEPDSGSHICTMQRGHFGNHSCGVCGQSFDGSRVLSVQRPSDGGDNG